MPVQDAMAALRWAGALDTLVGVRLLEAWRYAVVRKQLSAMYAELYHDDGRQYAANLSTFHREACSGGG